MKIIYCLIKTVTITNTENGKKKNMQKPLKKTTNPFPIHEIHILK